MRARTALHALWGLPQAAAGLVTAGIVGMPHERFHDAWVCRWRLGSGLSLGLFVFVPTDCPRRLLVHEYGHCVQSKLLGPLYVPLVVLPSLAWAGIPALRAWRRRHGVSYYALPTERWANWLGERVCHEPAM